MDIRGHAALVTGGASGFGAETARYLTAAGARVCLLDRNKAGIEEVASEIGGLPLDCDVADEKSVREALAQAREAYGPPRLLVNCAAIAEVKKIIDDDGEPMSLDYFRRVVDINLLGTFNMIRLAAAEMVKAPTLAHGERGLIVSTASIAVFEGIVGQAAYAASKGGVAAMTLPAAREFGPHGIRVVTIAPGLFNSPMLYALERDIRSEMVASVPFPKRFGDPAEFAMLVMHVIENAMINGTVLRIDGGFRY